MAGRFRPRREFKFWLFLDKPEESRLIEFIEYCKSKRAFARVVRDGIRLMWSLGEGDTTVLFELFPGLTAKLMPIPQTDTDNLERQILDLKKLILEQRHFNEPPPAPDKPSKLQKSIAMPLIIDDDDGDTIVLNKSAGTANGANLFAGIMGLGD